MEFDRGDDLRVDAPWAGPLSTAAGLVATLSWGCCTVLGPIAYGVALVATVLSVGAGLIALKRSPEGGDGYVLGVVGLSLAFGNALVLLIGLVFQLILAFAVFTAWFAASL